MQPVFIIAKTNLSCPKYRQQDDKTISVVPKDPNENPKFNYVPIYKEFANTFKNDLIFRNRGHG